VTISTTGMHVGLFVSLGISVVLLVGAIVLAHKHKTNAHIATIAAFLVAFLTTLGFAERLGMRYDLESVSMTIHLSIAITATLGALAPIATGLLHWRGNKVSRGTHKKIALTWFGVVVLALGTGVWMLSAGSVKPEFRDVAEAK